MKDLPGIFRQVTELLGGAPDEQLVGSRAAQGSGPRCHFVGHWVTEGISHKGRVLLSHRDRAMMTILLSNSSVIRHFPKCPCELTHLPHQIGILLSPFYDEATEAQRGEVRCSWSYR